MQYLLNNIGILLIIYRLIIKNKRKRIIIIKCIVITISIIKLLYRRFILRCILDK